MRIGAAETASDPRNLQLVERARALYGFEPLTISVMRIGATAADAYLSLAELNARSTLEPLEREYIAVRIAALNQCRYCLVGHCAQALTLGADAATINAVQRGVPVDARVDALVAFATAVWLEHGALDDVEVARARARGIGDATMLDVVTVVVENALGNMVNNLAQTPPEPKIMRFVHRQGVLLSDGPSERPPIELGHVSTAGRACELIRRAQRSTRQPPSSGT